MFQRLFAASGVAGGARALPVPTPRDISQWLARHRELVWVTLLVLVAAAAHGYNMFHFPYFESDEGTYMSQAWALAKLHKLAPYTYWYDHAPGGWVQVALWTTLTGGFYSFGAPVPSGRVLMLLMQIGSSLMVYLITRRVSRSPLAATIALLTFALSAYGTYYHRRVLLDNIATFWMLLSITLLLSRQLTLNRVWLSAAAIGVSILSKELTIFMVPLLALLTWHQTKPPQRSIATIGFLTITGCIFSLYLLMAVLKGELFPTGTLLGGTSDHVSLLGSLQYQAGRERDGGLLDWNSNFWVAVRSWSQEEPLLIYAGSAASVLAVLLMPWRRLIGFAGLLPLPLWLFMGRGGVTLPFYLVPVLPLLAICLGVIVGLLADGMFALLRRLGSVGRLGGRFTQAASALACLAFLTLGYHNPRLEFGQDPFVLWTSRQADVFQIANRWIIDNLPRDSRMLIDQSMWLELHDIPGASKNFDKAHYYWKVASDKEIREQVFHGDWRNFDYVVTTDQMLGDTSHLNDPLLNELFANSVPIATFDTGGWPIQVRAVMRPYPANASEVLARTWQSYRSRFIEQGRVIDRGSDGRTTSEGQAYAMMRAVYSDDHKTFDQVWGWTKANLQQKSGTLAWHWGVKPDGKQGVLDAGVASDADQDAALALLFASKRWNDGRYLQDARVLLKGLWDEATADVHGQRVLVAGNWARSGDPVINPSYFAPYAYRIFDQADPGRGWLKLVESSYTILDQIRADGRFGGTAGAVPNWLALDQKTGALQAATQFGAYANEFSYDAGRLPWRIALDALWNRDQRALRTLDGLNLPERAFTSTGKIAASYQLDGTPTSEAESISMYAGSIGQLTFSHDRGLAERVYNAKIAAAYHQNASGAYWGDPSNYYDQNWAWFATALASNQMPNLWSK